MRLMLVVLVCTLVTLQMPRHADAGAASTAGEQVSAPARQTQAGLLDRFTVWVLIQQRNFHRALTSRLRDLASEDGNWILVWPLITVSFLYGVFHAAGPGHGKAVVSGYLLSHRHSVRRGVMIAVAAAFVQGMVAIAIVYGLVKLAGLLPRDAQGAVIWSERMSYVLVIALGGYLLLRAVRRLRRKFRIAGEAVAHHHDHSGNDPDHEHCGHAHIPSAAEAETARDFKSVVAIILSIGARPCSGAVIVLIFANVVALPWAGIAAVLAMSAGTALTVAMLAVFAVTARNILSRLSWMDAGRAGIVSDFAAATGGAVILLLGVSLLSAAMTVSHPLAGM